MSIIEFGAVIQGIIERRSMTREESYRMFRELMLNSQSDLQQGAFLAALSAKGETVDEIVGAWQAIDELDTVHVSNLPDDVVDNSGTGMDGFKIFNVSSAAALVAAANGIPVARHGARAITSRCGTVDIMEAMGINVEIDPSASADSVRNVGIGLFNGMSSLVHPGGLGRILSQIRFGTTFNIAASLASPARPKVAMRGVYARPLIEPVGQVMRKIGYRRALVVHGRIEGMTVGVDELSVCGATSIHRIDGDAESSFDLSPQEAGLTKRSAPEIAATGSLAEESRRFLSVVAGNGRFEGCEDFVSLNAGALLWMEGVSPTISAGVVDARHTLVSGGALDKLRQWASYQSGDTHKGIERLQQLEREVLITR